MKECNKCKVQLVVGENIKLSVYKNYDYTCDTCRNQRTKHWKQQNVEKVSEYNLNYRKENKDYYIEYDRQRYLNNKEKIKEYVQIYQKNRKQTDPLFKLTCTIRGIIGNSYKRATKDRIKKPKKTEEILGCDINFFIEYISSLFKEGMSIHNYGKWHLDHIYPISLAKDEEELIKLNHYTNFQPLWAHENLKKSNKIL